jgi:hypothetical protein
MALAFVAAALLWTGCRTMPHEVKWEYRVAEAPRPPTGASPREREESQQAFLDNLGKDGWILVSQTEGRTFYFMRPIK